MDRLLAVHKEYALVFLQFDHDSAFPEGDWTGISSPFDGDLLSVAAEYKD
jgi:hypothetical protein